MEQLQKISQETLRSELAAGQSTHYQMKLPASINRTIKEYKDARKAAGLLRMNKDEIILEAMVNGFPAMFNSLNQ